MSQRASLRSLCLVQGLYYTATGIWPLVHMPSFILVTGEKTDLWLVRMVGALTLAIGVSFLFAHRWRRQSDQLVIFLAVATAASYFFVDVLTVIAGTISAIYLVDAATQLVLLIGWLSYRVPEPPWDIGDHRSPRRTGERGAASRLGADDGPTTRRADSTANTAWNPRSDGAEHPDR